MHNITVNHPNWTKDEVSVFIWRYQAYLKIFMGTALDILRQGYVMKTVYELK